ncbi:MAG: hypothetical protein ACOYXM_08475 [Actinomycetota bacterium]
MRPGRGIAVVLAVAALAPAACGRDEPDEGEARLEVDGQAIVERRDGAEEVIDGETTLKQGDRVELSEGVGRLVMRDGVRMELREGIDDAANSMLLMGTTPVLEAGDLLVAAPKTSAVSAAGTDVVIRSGAARVSRSLGVGVSAYDGVVHLDSAGLERDIPALREMMVPALGRPPRAPRPLRYQAEDPWDRRFLGEAIELGRTLEALANGYTVNLNRGEGRTPGFFRVVLPQLEEQPEFGASLIDIERAPGETLIGAAIAVLGRQGSFVERWNSTFGFREEGAEWGLVALDQEVSGTPLLGAIEEAVSFSPLTFAAPGRSGGSGTGAGSDGGGPTTSTTTPTTPTTSPPTTSPPTTEPPPPTTLPPDLLDVLAPILEEGGEAASDLVGGLLG